MNFDCDAGNQKKIENENEDENETELINALHEMLMYGTYCVHHNR